MNTRTLVTLLVSLAVLLALVVAVSVSQRQGAGSSDLLLPDLRGELNAIDKITIRTGGNKTIATLVKEQDRWTLAERNGYPADIGRIRKNLIALAEARILEEKTANPEFYNRLGVDDIDKESASGLQLDLGAGEKVSSVIIGNTGVSGGDRAYARRAGEAVSWLVSGSFDAPRETSQWLERGIADIEPKRVHAVTITHPQGPALRVEKDSPEGLDFEVAALPAGRELSFPTVANSVGGALSDLTLENVEPQAAFDPGKVQPIVARFETFDGLVLEASTWNLPEGAKVGFTASADQALAERFARQPAGADEKPAADAPEAGTDGSFDEVKAEAAELNERIGGWVYTLPDYKGEQLTKKLEDLLAPRPPGK